MKDFFEQPDALCVMASCDRLYLDAHGTAFVASNAIVDNSIHIHVMEMPTESRFDTLSKLNQLRIRYKAVAQKGKMTFSIEKLQIPSGTNSEVLRTYFASNRFLVAPQLLEAGGAMYLSDIDSLFNEKLRKIDADVGLFLRDPLPGTVGWEALGTRVAAGLVYYSGSQGSRDFAAKVHRGINTNGLVWFTDQVALYQTYHYYEKSLTFHRFDGSTMDWEFIEGTPIWTGKGARKDKNDKYIARKRQYESKLPSVKGAFWS